MLDTRKSLYSYPRVILDHSIPHQLFFSFSINHLSAEYESLVISPSNQGGVQALSPCGFNNRVQRGIQLHAAKSGGSNNIGYQISDVTFERFGAITGCWDSAAFDVDSREDSGYFDPRASIKSANYIDVDEAARINLCDTQSSGIDYIHIQTDGGYNG